MSVVVANYDKPYIYIFFGIGYCSIALCLEIPVRNTSFVIRFPKCTRISSNFRKTNFDAFV